MGMDELDQLIESSVNFEESTEEPGHQDDSPDETDATGSDAEFADGQESDQEQESEVADAQEDDLPDPDPDGTDDTPADEDPAPPAPSEPDPEVVKLRGTVSKQQEFIAAVLKDAQQRQAQADAQKAKEERDRKEAEMMARWDEMDPDDARREQVQYVLDRSKEEQAAILADNEQLRKALAASDQAKGQAEYEAREAEAKAAAINYLKEEFKLTDFDVETLQDMSTPMQMENYARRSQERRKAQTQNAREAKRQELEKNPAIRGGDVGQGAPIPAKEAKNLDEFVDNLW